MGRQKLTTLVGVPLLGLLLATPAVGVQGDEPELFAVRKVPPSDLTRLHRLVWVGSESALNQVLNSNTTTVFAIRLGEVDGPTMQNRLGQWIWEKFCEGADVAAWCDWFFDQQPTDPADPNDPALQTIKLLNNIKKHRLEMMAAQRGRIEEITGVASLAKLSGGVAVIYVGVSVEGSQLLESNSDTYTMLCGPLLGESHWTCKILSKIWLL